MAVNGYDQQLEGTLPPICKIVLPFGPHFLCAHVPADQIIYIFGPQLRQTPIRDQRFALEITHQLADHRLQIIQIAMTGCRHIRSQQLVDPFQRPEGRKVIIVNGRAPYSDGNQ
ncbi:hypothetical protein D3C73_787210 [compost metagenome]